MNGCIYRTRSDLCMKFTTDQSISFCVGKKCPDRKESNADRIRSMTDEELANWLATITNPNTAAAYNGYCLSGSTSMFLEWLQSESGEA